MKQFDEKQIAGLQRLLSLLDPDSLTKEQFAEAFKKVLDYIKKIEEKNLSELDVMSKSLKTATEALKNATSNDFSGLKGEIIQLTQKQLAEVNTGLKKKIEEIDQRLSEIKNGEDADEDLIVDKVLSQIKFPEIKGIDEDLPKMGTQIRDALELLNGDERLDYTAIKGLRNYIKGLVKDNSKPAVGGLRPANTGIETLSGTIDGNNTVFTVSWIPEFITVNGQSMYNGYGFALSSVAGVLTITFENAPQTGDIIRSHYKEA